MVLEQRGSKSQDWAIEDLSQKRDTALEISQGSKTTSELDPKTRKQLHNAPKRIAKLESMIEEAEEKIAELDEEMLSNGNDVGKLVDLQKDRDGLQAKVEGYMEEWEELEELLATHAQTA